MRKNPEVVDEDLPTLHPAALTDARRADAARTVTHAQLEQSGCWSVYREANQATPILTALSYGLALKASLALSQIGIKCTIKNSVVS